MKTNIGEFNVNGWQGYILCCSTKGGTTDMVTVFGRKLTKIELGIVANHLTWWKGYNRLTY
jgi:hypothetical protein